jgi:hypothetical protein
MSDVRGAKLIPGAQAFAEPQAEHTLVFPSQPQPHSQPQLAFFTSVTIRLAIGPQQDELLEEELPREDEPEEEPLLLEELLEELLLELLELWELEDLEELEEEPLGELDDDPLLEGPLLEGPEPLGDDDPPEPLVEEGLPEPLLDPDDIRAPSEENWRSNPANDQT